MSLSQTVTWIPLEERIPEAAKEVLIATRDGGVLQGWRYDARDRFLTPCGEEIEDATHWAEMIKHPSACIDDGRVAIGTARFNAETGEVLDA